MLLTVLVISWILLPSIVTLIGHRVLFSVVRLLVRELGSLMLAVFSIASERNTAAITFFASPLDDKWRLFAWRRHEIGVAIVLVALLVGIHRRLIVTLARIVLLGRPLSQGLRVVAAVHACLFIDVDHAASRAILGVVLLPASAELS